jgi:polar amino acid transport system permease protein
MAGGLQFGWLADHGPALLHGSATTLLLVAIVLPFGLALGILGAVAPPGWRRRAVVAYVEAIRNTPFIVQLFFVFFGLPSLGVRLDGFTAAVLAMTVNMGAFATEMVRAGLSAVQPGQREAGQALGLRRGTVFRRVVLPQALRAVFPALASQAVITLLESAVVSQIAVRDLTYEADLIQSTTFRSFETYAVVAVVYLLFSVLLRRGFGLAGHRVFGRTA